MYTINQLKRWLVVDILAKLYLFVSFLYGNSTEITEIQTTLKLSHQIFKQPRLKSVATPWPLVLSHHLTFTFLQSQTYTFQTFLVSSLSLKGVIGKILFDFCLKACTSWFAVKAAIQNVHAPTQMFFGILLIISFKFFSQTSKMYSVHVQG